MEDNNVGITIESLSNTSFAFSSTPLTMCQVANSSEDFKAIVSNEALFADILDKLKATRVGDKITQYHATPVTDPRPALSGPLTEVGGT
jgi:hypothetical protein